MKLNHNQINKKQLAKVKKITLQNSVSQAIISSVVPSLNNTITDFLNECSVRFCFFKNLSNKINLKINIKNKEEVGDDRLVNILYAKEKYKKSVVVIDFGTATTFDILNKEGVYFGGIITPGIELSLNILKLKTEKLPLVEFKKTKTVVGFSTKEAIQSGFYWGYYSMIEGLIKKINKELNDEFRIILTGGNAKYFKKSFGNTILVDEHFTSRALNFILGKL